MKPPKRQRKATTRDSTGETNKRQKVTKKNSTTGTRSKHVTNDAVPLNNQQTSTEDQQVGVSSVVSPLNVDVLQSGVRQQSPMSRAPNETYPSPGPSSSASNRQEQGASMSNDPQPDTQNNLGCLQLYTLGSSPIIVDKVKTALWNFPDQDIARNLINGLENGFKLNYNGPRVPFLIRTKDLLGDKRLIAEKKILKEISLRRIAGPFHAPPFPTFRTSPISIVPKKSSSEFRLIHNLSFPQDYSVNDFIDKEYCSVKYSNIDDAINMIYRLGPGALLAKCDIKSAFRLLRIAPSDFDLMGFQFGNQYYFDKCLPMGASISCAIFESFSSALHWYVQGEAKNENIIHYLDDFLFGGEPMSSRCGDTLDIFQQSCESWGVPLAEEKTVFPTKTLIFLGVEFDTEHMIMRLPLDKLEDLKQMITLCLSKERIFLRDLQSIIGSLSWACRVIVPGRAFLRRLIDAICNVRKPFHRIRLVKGMKDDLKTWLDFLCNYNGTTLILDENWSSNSDLNLFTDSAGGKNLGFGIYFDGKWAHGTWPVSWQDGDILSDITFLELFPVVVALHIWGNLLKNKRLLFHIDNSAVVSIINKKSSKSVRVMTLVRKLVLACLEFNIFLKAESIPGCQNLLADSISRSNFQKFRDLCPTADEHPTPIPHHLWKI